MPHEMGEAEGDGSNAEKHLEDGRDGAPKGATELDLVKLALSNAKQQLKIKEKKMVALKSEVERAKDLQAKLAEKDSLLDESRKEVDNLKKKETRIQQLEEEIEKREESESKLYDFMAVQTKQLEQTKIALEESKLAIANLCSPDKSSGHRAGAYPRLFSSHELESLRSELRVTRESLCHAEESERLANLKVRNLLEELSQTKNELKVLSEAEENGKRAMDDLAVALKEVATEANQAKENLNFTRREIEKSNSEAAQAKFLMKSMENKYKSQLEQARKEAEEHKNISGRLRIEVDESNVAWHEKEALFVKCIKRAEEEKASAQAESKRCADALSDAKEKNKKLHEIVKQALDEANVAREEISLLKDSVAEKESALEILSREIENLRTNNVKDSKSLLHGTEEPQNGHASEAKREGLKPDTQSSLRVESGYKEEHKEVKNLADKEAKSSAENKLKDANILKENEVKDVKNSIEKECKDAKTSKDREDPKILKDFKDPKVLKGSDPEDGKISKDKNPKDPQVLKDKNPKDPQLLKDKDSRDDKILKDKDPKDANVLKDQDPKDANVLKDKDPKDPKILKELEDAKISKEKDPRDPKSLKDNVSKDKELEEAKILKDKDSKDPKILKEKEAKDPKTSKDKELKDPKIPNPKDAKVQKEKENNLMKLSRNCSLDFKDAKVAMHKEHKPPINKEAKPLMNNKKDGEDDNAIDDLLKGSIFDITSPVGKSTPKHKKSLSLSFADERSISAEDFEHDETREYEMEHEQEHHSTSRSRKKPLFKRFGNMLSRKSFIRREAVE